LLCLLAGVVYGQGTFRCGQTPVQPDLSSKIVGGHDATPYSWPWQVVWCTSGWFGGCDLECGGSVIAEGWVVTAGHCVYGDEDSPGQFRVKVGVFNEDSTTEDGEAVLKVKRIHLQPKYVPDPVPVWDISLIELADKIVFTDHVQPICFAANDNRTAVEPNSAWVTGWGTTSEGGDISQTLKQVQVPFVNTDTCMQEYPDDLSPETHVCAGRAGVDTCQGDSGGPLVVATNGTWFLYGLTSWGYGCAEAGHAGVYSRTTAYCNWIASETNMDVTCKDPFSY